jgi:hypothetical protein
MLDGGGGLTFGQQSLREAETEKFVVGEASN